MLNVTKNREHTLRSKFRLRGMNKRNHPYCHDNAGRTVLAGLTFEETIEFKNIDECLPFNGLHVWPTEALPLLPMEVRWQELWTKHQAAMAEHALLRQSQRQLSLTPRIEFNEARKRTG